MALINCPECSAQISDIAHTCTNCGIVLRKPKRTIFGKIIKWIFILFNILMLWWIIEGMGAMTDGMETMSEAEKAGTALGTGLGVVFIGMVWAIGDIILGFLVLFTRPKVR